MPRKSSLSSSRPVARSRTRVLDWFASRDWKPFLYQRQTWNAYLDGQSGLIHATTGMGKTLAAWLGPVIEWMADHETELESEKEIEPPPLTVLWVTPLRALAGDTLESLLAPINDLGIPWRVEARTGDTSSSQRAKQRKQLPTALVTTPESLTLFLTRADAAEQFRSLKLVVVDEWHELLASKRGTQVELALARLRATVPGLRTWGLSATLGNLEEAMHALCGREGARIEARGSSHAEEDAHKSNANTRDAVDIESTEQPDRLIEQASILVPRSSRLITGGRKKQYRVESLIPPDIERFPWAGHIGIKQLPEVVKSIESAETSLAFTNTRFQAEHWYLQLLKARPDWAGQIALHHGSLDQDARKWVEGRLKTGELKCVVCTSSLDLGVDFSPVERVFQIGSPKGIARLLQRAGRSGHAPGRASILTCVPTHAFELVEIAAARDAVLAGNVESRHPFHKPIDVLVQHAVTCAVGGGFTRDQLFEEVRTTAAYHKLNSTEWDWVLDFVTRGGEALRAYKEYRRVDLEPGGDEEPDRFVVNDKRIAQLHRMNVGTITSDTTLQVQYQSGKRVGTIEEHFASKLKPGDNFRFAGVLLEFVRIYEMRVIVKKPTKKKEGEQPHWAGSRMPLSTELADAVLERLRQAREGTFEGPEMRAVRPILEVQQRWSTIPVAGELLIEQIRSREGHHIYIFPFAGRLVHEGIAALVGYRLGQIQPLSFSMSVNDYGFELLSPEPAPLSKAIREGLFSAEGLVDDILASVNAAEMAKRQFRTVARVSGLIHQSMPGAQRNVRQLQASTGLIFDVFQNYDPDNLLLQQSLDEVLNDQLEHSRIRGIFESLSNSEIRLNTPRYCTPMAFPLLAQRIRQKMTTEKLLDRIQRMQLQLEKAAGPA